MAVRTGEAPSVTMGVVPALPTQARIALYWRWLALSLVLGLSACLECIGLTQEGYANTYYAAGVKSMLTSWHNFFFVSFDAGGFVTIDKPPLGLWIEAASAKLLGFSGLSLLLPEALAGVLAVALLYHLVARAHGAVAGLLAALLLALTPISAIIDRNNTIDCLLILTLLLGGWAVCLAAERAQLRWLLLAAVIGGLAFNIKMLQAYLVLPAFALVYLCGARLRWRTRLAHLALATVVLVAVSFCWVAIVDATPASQRPFVSDSGTNSELSLVFGYNGLGRLTQTLFPGLTHLSILGDPIDLTIEPGMSPGIGTPGLFRLVSGALGGQASWFLLPALLGLLALVRVRRPQVPLERQGQAVLLWGGWLLAAGLFFSTARFFHLYYLVMIAPPIAALAGMGLPALWREYAAGAPLPGWRGQVAGWRGWLLPGTLVGTALLQVQFLNGYADWGGWLAVLVIGGCLVAAVALVIGRLRLVLLLSPEVSLRVTPAVAVGSLALGVLALLAAPASWAVASIASGAGGAWLPQAGSGAMGFGGGPGGAFGHGHGGGFSFRSFGGAPTGPRFNAGQAKSGPGGPGIPGAGGQSNPSGQGGFTAGGSSPTRGGTNQPGTSFGGQPGRFHANGGPGRGFGGRGGFGGGGFGGAGGAMTFAGSAVPTLDSRLLSYLEKHQGKATYLVATTTSSYASLFILDTNQSAMALGGYQGWDRILTLAQLKKLIANGTIRFFYLPDSAGGSGSPRQTAPIRPAGTASQQPTTSRTGRTSSRTALGTAAPQPATSSVAQGAASQNLANVNDDLTAWVARACTAVPTALGQSASSGPTNGVRGFGAGGGLQLYDCAGHA